MISSLILCFMMGCTIFFFIPLMENFSIPSLIAGAMNNAEIPFCHIVVPQALVPFLITKNIIFPARVAGHYVSITSMLLIWLVFTLTLGRGWCSWVCFYGGFEEGFRHIGKKRKINLLSKNKEIRNFSFGFLLFIVLSSLCEFACSYCEWFCPFKLVTEYNPANSIPSLIGNIIFISLFVVLVIVMPILTKRRTQCSALCPFGAIDITTIQEKKGHPEITCAKCGDCIKACPEKAISYSFKFDHKCGKHTEPKTKFGKVMMELLEPASLFRLAAFTFSLFLTIRS